MPVGSLRLCASRDHVIGATEATCSWCEGRPDPLPRPGPPAGLDHEWFKTPGPAEEVVSPPLPDRIEPPPSPPLAPVREPVPGGDHETTVVPRLKGSVVGWLRVLTGPDQGRSSDLREDDRAVIGTDARGDLSFSAAEATVRHASLVAAEGRFVITDCQSGIGLRVNGRTVDHVDLRDGDVVEVGGVRLRFKCLPAEDLVRSHPGIARAGRVAALR